MTIFTTKGLALKLTLARIYCIPLFVIFYFFHPEAWGQWLALGIYTFASISDYLDGYLARKNNEVSAFGAFLDPVADKLMVCTVLITVLANNAQEYLVFICALIIISREIWVSALREWLATVGKREAVAVSKAGKYKTACQMFALGFLIYREKFIGLPIWQIGQVLLVIATILTIYSLIGYTKSAFKAMQETKK
ncbi:MAG: CDP-diacylglycerol--glycerol-3-phosphate 3-phosphatidyltransferase [Cardiobacteriaceae bacterium]|nr:CDP-diacylglycerol--glycerol-3-phosphate 3-phosphatidyltransferase [Cardiobacteriaceae bacterium]